MDHAFSRYKGDGGKGWRAAYAFTNKALDADPDNTSVAIHKLELLGQLMFNPPSLLKFKVYQSKEIIGKSDDPISWYNSTVKNVSPGKELGNHRKRLEARIKLTLASYETQGKLRMDVLDYYQGIFPNSPEPHRRRGIYQLARRKYVKAAENFQKALELTTKDTSLNYLIEKTEELSTNWDAWYEMPNHVRWLRVTYENFETIPFFSAGGPSLGFPFTVQNRWK